jgi:hypothetical protein
MAHVNDHTESARIRTILKISAFYLATLEHELIRNAYVPESTNEQEIRDATYRLYTASTSQTARFYVSEGRSNIFDPYPYGGMPHHKLREFSGAQTAAAMADRNERESVKYDAVTDLIRMLATRKLREGRSDGAGVKVEQAAVKDLEEQLKAEKAIIEAKEDQLQVMRTTYAAVKLLVGEEHRHELREIDRTRYHKLKQLAASPAAAEADEVFQQLAEISVSKISTSSRGQEKKKEKKKTGGLQGSMWGEAGGITDDTTQETSTVAEDGANEEEEQSEISSADGPKASHKTNGSRIRKPRALVRARKAAMEIAAQAEDEIAQDLANGSMMESAANINEQEEEQFGSDIMARQHRFSLLVKAKIDAAAAAAPADVK